MINKLQNRQPWSSTIILWYIYMFVVTPNIIPIDKFDLCNVYLVLITAFNNQFRHISTSNIFFSFETAVLVLQAVIPLTAEVHPGSQIANQGKTLKLLLFFD